MLANDITLDKKDGTDVVFKLIRNNQDGTMRLDSASSLALPNMLVIKHSVTGKSPNQVDRHLIQINKGVQSSTGIVTANLNFTLTVPRDAAVTPTIIHDMVSHLVDFLQDGAVTGLATTANLDAILRGES